MQKFVVLLLVAIPFLSFGQVQKNDWAVGPTYNNIQYKPFTIKNAFGVSAEFRFAKHIGFELSIAGGKDYIHYGVGSVLLPPLLLLGSKEKGPGFIIFLLQIIACAEQTNFHLPLGKHFEIVPFISILKLRYIYESTSTIHDTFFASWSAGTKFSIITSKTLNFSFSYEISDLYESGNLVGQLNNSSRIFGQQFGVNVAYIFKTH